MKVPLKSSQAARSSAVSAAVVLAVSLALSACSSSSSEPSIAAVLKGLDQPVLPNHAERGAGRCHRQTMSKWSPGGNVDHRHLPARETSSPHWPTRTTTAFIVNPISGTNLIQGIARLAAAKKPIVNIDSPSGRGCGQAGQRHPGQLHRHRQRGRRQDGRRRDVEAAS